MKQTRLMMGMPITLEIVDASANDDAFNAVFDYFQYVDETFSTYKAGSQISRIERGVVAPTTTTLAKSGEALGADLRFVERHPQP